MTGERVAIALCVIGFLVDVWIYGKIAYDHRHRNDSLYPYEPRHDGTQLMVAMSYSRGVPGFLGSYVLSEEGSAYRYNGDQWVLAAP